MPSGISFILYDPHTEALGHVQMKTGVAGRVNKFTQQKNNTLQKSKKVGLDNHGWHSSVNIG